MVSLEVVLSEFVDFSLISLSDPMRITKKYAGKSCIGKQIYQPCEGFQDDLEGIREAEKELEMFEKIFLNKIQSKTATAVLHSPANRSRSPSQRILEKKSWFDPSPLKVNEVDESENLPQDSYNVNGVAQSLFGSSKGKLSSKRFGFPRRNMSAPNLSSAEDPALQAIKEENEDKFRRNKITEEFFLLGGRLPLSRGDQTQESSNHSSTSSFSAKKRSHSVMALMDFERLVADDRAAGNPRSSLCSVVISLIGDLFYEFITMMGSNVSKKRQQKQAERTQGSQRRQRRALSEEGTVAIDDSPVKMEEEEESSLQSRETMVHRYNSEAGTEAAILVNHEGGMVVVQQSSQHPSNSSNVSTVSGHDEAGEDCDNFF